VFHHGTIHKHWSMMEPSVDGYTDGTDASRNHGEIDPMKAQVLESLLQELSFWEPPTDSENGCLRKSRSVSDVHHDEVAHPNRGLIHATSYSGNCSSHIGDVHPHYPHSHERNEEAPGVDVTPPVSPTLAELQANCFWNKAIDPSTGRTYYYDIRTRQTQWEKVRNSLLQLWLKGKYEQLLEYVYITNILLFR
jgi:hypothetical protein